VELRTVSTSPMPPGVRGALVTAVDAAARAVKPVASRRVSGGRHDGPGAASTGAGHPYGRTEVGLPLNAVTSRRGRREGSAWAGQDRVTVLDSPGSSHR